MRVGILIPRMDGGGAERVAGEISIQLEKLGMEVYLLTFFKAKEEYPFAGIRLCCSATSANAYVKALKRFKWIQKMKREEELDMVISFLPQANFLNLLSGGRRILSFRNNPDGLPTLYQVLFGLTIHWADRIVAVSCGVEKRLLTMYPQIYGKVTTIYNPIGDFSIEKRALRPVKTFLSVGRLVEQKAQDRLILAFREVAKTRNDIRLQIVGKGPLREELQALIDRLGLTERIELVPYTMEIEQLYREADAFVFSSRYEGFGNVLIEAMAKGLPVISTDCPWGPREIIAPDTPFDDKADGIEVHRFGILTSITGSEEETVENLAEAMRRLMEDEELRASLQEAGVERVADFSKEKAGQAWRRILNL